MAKSASNAGHAERVRRFHTRSRAGCVNCKQRHRRCDEQRPSCSKCVDLNESCYYKPVGIPLRERGIQTQPGEQAPWTVQHHSSLPCMSTPQYPPPPSSKSLSPPKLQVSTSWQVVPWQSADPFEVLPINMPLRSKELLHYFIQGNHAARSVAGDSVGSIFQDPHGLRNLMLIAGIHYAWHVGNLQSFQPTYLFHKIQSIHTVNAWIEKGSQINAVAACAKLIATLCFAECYLGNVKLGEMHLLGLVRYLETRLWNNKHNSNTVTDAERELIDRYLILCYSIVLRLKSPLQDAPQRPRDSDDTEHESSPGEFKYIEHRSEVYDGSGSGLRLKSIQMFPFFFNLAPTISNYQNIDSLPTIQCLRDITDVLNTRGLVAAGKVQVEQSSRPDLNRVVLPRLLFVAMKSHIDSLPDDNRPSALKEKSLETPWAPMSVASGMYMTGILNAWKITSPMESRLLCHLAEILGRDARENIGKITGNSERARNLWFWKAFVGAFNVAHAQPFSSKTALRQILVDFSRHLRMWSEATGITQWVKVKEILSKVAWPANFKQEDAAKLLWNKAILSKEVSNW